MERKIVERNLERKKKEETGERTEGRCESCISTENGYR
jgi:hypothetical protein